MAPDFNCPHDSPRAVCLHAGTKTLFRQSVVAPLAYPENPPAIGKQAIPPTPYGSNILLLIPTANHFKRKAIQSKLEALLGSNPKCHLIVHQQEVDSGVGNQPYDENGIKGAYTRIRNALCWIEGNDAILQENGIGTVVVGAIENYIQRPSQEQEPAVDYGVVIMYNATSQKASGIMSRGVTVPKQFLDEAKAEGFDDREERSGKVTVGQILGRTFGIDKADWHKTVSGISRYTLLQEALDAVHISL